MRPRSTRAWILGGAMVVLAAGTAATFGVRSTSSTPPRAAPLEAHAPRCRTTRASPVLRAPEMTAICDDVYAEPGLDAALVDRLKGDVESATRSLETFFGPLRATPLVLFCRTATCKIAFGAPPRAAASNDLGFASAQVMLDDGGLASSAVVVTGPVERTAQVLTHELVHAEMKAWVSYDALPTWFNEGVATFVADEPHCDVDAATAPEIDVTRLRKKATWQRHLSDTGKTRETYCAARDEVAKWMSRFGPDVPQRDALVALLTAVSNGTPFDTAFDAR